MRITGTAIRVRQSDDINTDYIISGRYKFAIQDPAELARHIFEDIEPDFFKRLKGDDILIAGKNFGMGSSREQAPVAIKAAGIKAVVASSFARIFYRNAFNVGLALVECDTSKIKQGDNIQIDLGKGALKFGSGELKLKPTPDLMLKFLEHGGAVEYFKTKVTNSY